MRLRDGAGGMSSGGDLGEEDHEQACGGQNVFREVFDERSEPSETGETLGRHTNSAHCGKDP